MGDKPSTVGDKPSTVGDKPSTASHRPIRRTVVLRSSIEHRHSSLVVDEAWIAERGGRGVLGPLRPRRARRRWQPSAEFAPCGGYRARTSR